MAVRDKIVNAITGRNVETVPMTLEQMLEMIKKYYVSQATTDDELNVIMKTIKGGLFNDKMLTSKDGRYEIRCSTGRNVGIFNMKKHNLIWVHDMETDKYYEYCAWSFKKLKRGVSECIANIKAGI